MRSGFWWSNIGNFLNKIIGLFRTHLKLIVVGDSVLSDLFLLADKTISLIRRLFVDGSFQSIFINHYNIEKVNNNEKSFATSSLKFMLMNLSLVTIIFLVLSPFFVSFFHQNAENEKILLHFLFSLSPLIILIFLMSFFTSLLNSNYKFRCSSIAPVIGNIVFTGILFLASKKIIHWSLFWVLSIGSIAYAFIQSLFMICFSLKFFKKSEDNVSDKFKKDVIKGIGINLIVPLSEVIIGIIATQKKNGLLSHLEYGHKYIFTAFSILCIPVSNSVLPLLSQLFQNGEKQKFQSLSTKIFILIHVLSIPTIFFLYFFTSDLLSLLIRNINLVQHKEAMCQTVSIVSLSLYFLMQNRILNNIYNVSNNLNYSLKGSIIYGTTSIFLTFVLQNITDGLAWVSNIAYLLQFLFLLYFAFKQNLLFFSKQDKLTMVLSIVISCIFTLILKIFYLKYSLIYTFIIGVVLLILYIVAFWNYFKLLFLKKITF